MSTSASIQKSFAGSVPVPNAADMAAFGAMLFAARFLSANVSSTNNNGKANHDAGAGPYDLSVAANRVGSISWSEDNGVTFKTQNFTLTPGATPAATTAAEIATQLTALAPVNQFFTFANNAGTLRIIARQASSRFKTYFGGALAAILAGVWTTAIASGSSVASSNQAGNLVDVIVEDVFGNPVPFAEVKVTVDVGGAAPADAQVGLPTKGTINGNRGGFADVEFTADKDGLISFYVMNNTAEVLNVNVFANAGTIAQKLKPTAITSTTV